MRLRSKILGLKRRAGHVRRALPSVRQRAVVMLRKRLARPISAKDLASLSARLKARHFGRPDQLDIGAQSVWDTYLSANADADADHDHGQKHDDHARH